MAKAQPHPQYSRKRSKGSRIAIIVPFTSLEPAIIEIAATMKLAARASSSMLVRVSLEFKSRIALKFSSYCTIHRSGCRAGQVTSGSWKMLSDVG